jgi:hypothetical protein
MAAEDDAYCKQQKAQAYADCCDASIAYRQTMGRIPQQTLAQMFQAAVAAQAAQNAEQAQAMRNLRCLAATVRSRLIWVPYRGHSPVGFVR